MKKKILALTLGFTMVVGMLTACGSSSSTSTSSSDASASSEDAAEDTAEDAAEDAAEEETTLTGEAPAESRSITILSMWPEDDEETTANGAIITAMCEKYKEEVDPNFSWEYEYVSSDNLRTKVQTLAASNDLPDIFAYDAGTPLVDLIDAGLVLDITQALEDMDVYDTLDNGATTYLAALTGTDHIYDLPLGLNIEGFWYNKELFAQAGIEKAPETWDEMLEDADKLLEAGIQPFATGAADMWPTTRLIHAYAIREMGADCMNKAADGELAYNSEGFIKAAQMIQDMNLAGYFGEGATTVDQNTAADMLLSGQTAMIYNGSWYTSSLNADTNPAGQDGIGFFSVPTVEGGEGILTEYPMNCGTILCLNSKTYDETMASFLKFFVSNVGDYSMSNFGALKGYVVDETVSADMPSYTKMVAEEMNKVTGTANWFEALMASELSAMAQQNVQSLMNGDMTAEEYCEQLEECYQDTK